MKKQVVLWMKKNYVEHKRIEKDIELIDKADLVKRAFQRMQVFNPSALGVDIYHSSSLQPGYWKQATNMVTTVDSLGTFTPFNSNLVKNNIIHYYQLHISVSHFTHL